jgi:hypothetical protein
MTNKFGAKVEDTRLGCVLISLNVQVEGGGLGAQKLNSACHELSRGKHSRIVSPARRFPSRYFSVTSIHTS